jgi:hypothetical protein
VGGALIGLSALALLLFSGRIAGVSGILGGLLIGPPKDLGWRLAFLLGLFVGGLVFSVFHPEAFAIEVDRSFTSLIVAGFLVGVGTRMGGGCTSGHGVCGVSRLSKRSIIATLTFMVTGALTVAVVQRVWGGVL